MIDGGAYDADKAYKDSKLCNILFTRELARRLAAAGSPVEAVAFGPGLITRTGFFRNQNPVFTALFDFATNEVFHVAESVSGGGDCLVTMATRAGLPSGAYYNNDLDGKGGHRFEAQPPSKEAQSDDEAARLWALSAQLVGLPA
jgi:protochlorophyllide reductase